MKIKFYLILMTVTFILAGMFHNFSFLILSVMEVIIFITAFLMTKYFQKRLSFSFVREKDYVSKSERTVISIRINYTGKLPIGKIILKVRYGYITGYHCMEEEVVGACECGRTDLTFDLSVELCGLVWVQLKDFFVYDYFNLFSARKNISENMKVAVFPVEQIFDLNMISGKNNYNSLSNMISVIQKGDAQDEIRQIREYRAGDAKRHIYWNLSAKMDELWLKEYEIETDVQMLILLDTTNFYKIGIEAKSAFYDIISAIILTLLKRAANVCVCWYDGNDPNLNFFEVGDFYQDKEMLLQLYNADFQYEPTRKQMDELEKNMEGDYFKFTYELAWYMGDKLIHQFEKKTFRRELRDLVFTI